MTDQTLTVPTTAAADDSDGPVAARSTLPAGAPIAVGTFDVSARATEFAILDALRSVVDPEIGMNVVELALIRQIILGDDLTEIKMILTTPFCPYAGAMIAQVKEATEEVVDTDVKVTLLAERWDPKDAGLVW